MARFGSLNRARQKAHYNALAKVPFGRKRATPPKSRKLAPPTSDTRKWLQVHLPSGDMAYAVFVRKAGQFMWRCTGTDHPPFQWFTGIRNPSVIGGYLSKKRLLFRWLSYNPSRTAKNRDADHPGERPYDTQASAVNTVPALQNPKEHRIAGGMTPCRNAALLAQTGVTTSLLLNSSHSIPPTAV